MATTHQSRDATRRTLLLLLVGSVAAGGVLWATMAVTGATDPVDLADPGPLTRWGVPSLRLLSDASAVVTIGALVMGVLVLPASGSELGRPAVRLVTTAARWAVAWTLALLLSIPLTASLVLGTSLTDLRADQVLLTVAALPQTRSMLSSAWLAGLVAVAARRTSSRATGILLVLIAGAALLPPFVSGHVATDRLATVGLLVHVAAASCWVGGLVVLVLHLRSDLPTLAAAVPRYSRLAAACAAAVAASGALVAWTSLGSPGPSRLAAALASPYGWLVVMKIAALLALIAFGLLHRRSTVAAVAGGRPGAFLRVAALEVVLMLATVGLAVGLSRTPPPAGVHAIASATSTPSSEHGLSDLSGPAS